VLGTVLSMLGYLGAGLVGFLIGRHSEAILARFVPPEEQARADRLLNEWGWFAVIMTRPLPLLAETTAIMAGASAMTWRSMLLASLAGSLPVALLYALTGATAANFDSIVLSLGFALLMAGLFWMAGRRLGITLKEEW
ncbi:MAG TPA: VTT domain-containing protein, partial [Anaerolineae bacterium]|nr:VTT domain-containing protein [Anaerolineae bacterium]